MKTYPKKTLFNIGIGIGLLDDQGSHRGLNQPSGVDGDDGLHGPGSVLDGKGKSGTKDLHGPSNMMDRVGLGTPGGSHG